MCKRNNYDHLDITGKRFGMLKAVKKCEGTESQWIFICDCGKEVQLPISRVFHRQKSCGCLRQKTKIEWGLSHETHGQSRTKLYRKYRSMLSRCYRKDNWNYKRYGGRGIKVCEEWKNSFECFQEWALKTGYDPKLDGKKEQSLDRINNEGDYSPDNCRWATAYEQQKNRDGILLYEHEGEMYTASGFADKFHITDKSFVYLRLKKNHQSLQQILDDWNKIHNIPDYLEEVSEYAKRNNISEGHTKRLINQGKVKGEKVGRKWYVCKT